jgi:hypothetical protein
MEPQAKWRGSFLAVVLAFALAALPVIAMAQTSIPTGRFRARAAQAGAFNGTSSTMKG